MFYISLSCFSPSYSFTLLLLSLITRRKVTSDSFRPTDFFPYKIKIIYNFFFQSFLNAISDLSGPVKACYPTTLIPVLAEGSSDNHFYLVWLICKSNVIRPFFFWPDSCTFPSQNQCIHTHTHTWSKRLARYVFRPDNLLCLNVLWQLLFYLYLKGGSFSCREKKMKLLGHVSWTNITVWHPRALPLSHLSRRWTERSFPEECVWIEDWFGEMGHGLACSQMMKLTCKRHSMLMPSL